MCSKQYVVLSRYNLPNDLSDYRPADKIFVCYEETEAGYIAYWSSDRAVAKVMNREEAQQELERLDWNHARDRKLLVYPVELV